MSTDPPSLTTDRLVMRAFTDDDRAPFAAINADPVVMAHYPSALTRDASDAFVDRVHETWAQQGFGLWALELCDTAAFIGYAGLWPVPAQVPVPDRPTPCVEVGWRLAARHWGRGYATEAAREALRFAFDDLLLDEVVSFTAQGNDRSRAVMRRLGMGHDDGDDFEHPALAPGHPLRSHVLYRARRIR